MGYMMDIIPQRDQYKITLGALWRSISLLSNPLIMKFANDKSIAGLVTTPALERMGLDQAELTPDQIVAINILWRSMQSGFKKNIAPHLFDRD